MIKGKYPMREIVCILIFLLIILTNCKEKKTKILIIGDSISIGYFPYIKHELGKYNVLVEHNEGNAKDTGTGLNNIRKWIGNENWDIIQFNWGLWDLCYREPNSSDTGRRDKMNGQITTPLENYGENIDSIVQILKTSTKAKLIFVTTSYVPVNEPGRYGKDVVAYNNVAIDVMKKHEVIINDIYHKSIHIHNKFGKDSSDVHYSNDGYKELSKSILQTLMQEVKKLK